ncbi:SLATT domain-containing protein [Vibrio alginolyticus]|uniref:SLATT domain-containing protein n=1 Tax=Vibrio alginolyticus TaxID=663 RepID=UPI00215C833C|nr:SLATT domain-containing protein [Vibrio alginolyticus]MCR9642254.1 SLATT domain-containing protein [Vibrio alginolyticus]
MKSTTKGLPASIWRWFFSLQDEEVNEQDPAKKLLNSMRITAKCRFNASVRLTRISNYSFLTTTMLSLGLIFIPLYQNSGLPIRFTDSVLSMLQIFLAVAVLVYSVVNATAKYDLRAEALDNCGVNIKELIRTLRTEISESKSSGVSLDLESYHKKYHFISAEPENHSRVDHLFAVLESSADFNITGVKRLFLYIKSYIMYFVPYIIPSAMMLFEIMFILDMLGITTVYSGVFNELFDGLTYG